MASRIEQVLTPAALWVHSRVYTATRGWIGHRILGVPCLLLHSVGAKSGAPRTHALSYAKDGAAYVVVASKGGAPTNPAWLHNVRKRPDVDINVGPRRVAVRARVVSSGDPDHPRLWKLVNDNNSQRYAAYQRRTSRPIPLVASARADGGPWLSAGKNGSSTGQDWASSMSIARPMATSTATVAHGAASRR